MIDQSQMPEHKQVPKDFILSVAEQRDKLNETYRSYRSAIPSQSNLSSLLAPVYLSCLGKLEELSRGNLMTCIVSQEDAQHIGDFVGTAQDNDAC